MRKQNGAGPDGSAGGGDARSAAEMVGLIAAQETVIARQAAELERQRWVFERASQAAGIGLWQCRLADEALTWSGAVYALFGLPAGAALDRGDIVARYLPESAEELAEKRARALEQRSGFSMDACIATSDNGNRWIRITASVESIKGRPVRLFGMKQDVTEAKLLLDRKRYLADFDAMTGLANRHRFEECLAEIRARDRLGALMLVDLDGFKNINDTHGHAVGDLCLREAAARLEEAGHGKAQLVARIGGDEFALVFDHTASLGSVSDAARSILRRLAEPLVVEGRDLRLSASIGIATRTGGFGADPFVEADIALYAAKRAGKSTFRLAKPTAVTRGRSAAA